MSIEHLIFWGAVVLVVLFVGIAGRLDEKKNKKWIMGRLKKRFGQASDYRLDYDALNHIKRYFEKHKQAYQIDDITYNDLNMDKLFEQMNFTLSSCGEEYLYYRLRTPFYEEKPLEDFEKKTVYFMEAEEKRLEAQFAFQKLGKLGKYSLYDYLDHLEDLGEINNLPMIAWDLAVIPAAALMFVSVPWGLIALVAVLAHNIFTYFKKRKKIDPYITSFAYIFHMLAVLDEMQGVFEGSVCDEEAQIMRECSASMRSFKKGAFLVMNGGSGSTSSNPMDILMDYINMIFFVDLLKFNHMLSCVRQKKDMIEKCLSVIGYLETVISVGMYRASLANGYCVPVFDGAKYRAEQMYHPLLQQPVKNTLHTDRNVLLTGSNASGKSTFLKTVSVNAILAQTIHTCTASAYTAPFYIVLSSMNLSDSVEKGDSYYVAEIKAIRRIFEAQKDPDRSTGICCFLDEVLRGTNTVERISAATQILQELSDAGVRCFAATHDIELTELLADAYEMYHFEETVEQDDIYFSYELLRDKASTRNAIKLLQLMGFDGALIEKAERRAETFVSTGIWEKGE